MAQHLCLVVKLQTGVPEKKKDEVFIIRVGNNLDQGIVIQSWEEFRIYKTQKYNDCWFRHLYCDRDDEFLQKTQNFIQKMREKPFVTKKADPTQKESVDRRRLYRDAELISKYYKVVHILPQQNPDTRQSIKYDSKQFSTNLSLLNNASFGDEQIIMFREKEIQSKIQQLQHQVEQQHSQIIQKTKHKQNEKIGMSIICEEDIEHTIRMKRKNLQDESFVSHISSAQSEM